MPVYPSSVAGGDCYITASNQVRKVIDIGDGKVKYVSRGKKVGPWGSWETVDLDKFAAAVDRKVPCNYDPDFDPDLET